MILNTLGFPSTEDKKFISDKEALAFVENISVPPGKVVFKNEFEEVDERLGDLLQSHLVFNPNLRKSSRELLKCSIFDAVRDEERETKVVYSLSGTAVALDKEGAFDYSEGVCIFNIDTLALLLEKEINLLNV